jgi:hypothetical protein
MPPLAHAAGRDIDLLLLKEFAAEGLMDISGLHSARRMINRCEISTSVEALP